MERKDVLFVVLVLAGLFIAGVAYTQFYIPTVSDKISTPFEAGTGAGGAGGEAATVVVNISANESEENNGVPKWWYWSEGDWQKFQWHANETEVIWTYNETTGDFNFFLLLLATHYPSVRKSV